MNECHEFWFWFTRPFAEFLGSLVLLVVLIVGILGTAFVWGMIGVYFDRRKETKK